MNPLKELWPRYRREDARVIATDEEIKSNKYPPYQFVELLTPDELKTQLNDRLVRLGEEFDGEGRDPYSVAEMYSGRDIVLLDALFRRAEREEIVIADEMKGIVRAGFEAHKEEIETDPNLKLPDESRAKNAGFKINPSNLCFLK